MREPERIERITNLIMMIWREMPNLRFMQLIDHLQALYNKKHGDIHRVKGYSIDMDGIKNNGYDIVAFRNDISYVDLFYVEDDKMEKFLTDYLNDLLQINDLLER